VIRSAPWLLCPISKKLVSDLDVNDILKVLEPELAGVVLELGVALLECTGAVAKGTCVDVGDKRAGVCRCSSDTSNHVSRTCESGYSSTGRGGPRPVMGGTE
jgi:hypothetical protein